MTLDRKELRRLAEVADADDQPATCAVAMTRAELALSKALGPRGVLALLDRIDMLERHARPRAVHLVLHPPRATALDPEQLREALEQLERTPRESAR